MARTRTARSDQVALFAAALLVAIGGLIYELILGAAASYLIGDSILSFSLATGMTLFGMGVGSLVAAKIRWQAAKSFALNEILLGLLGGNSVLLLYIAFSLTQLHWLVFGMISVAIGVLIGLEIPLLVKMFQEYGRKSSVELLGKVLALDYFGALIASLLFPLILLPYLGLMRSAYLVAALNIVVAMVILRRLKGSRNLIIVSGLAIMALTGLGFGAPMIEREIDRRLYRDPVVYHQQSSYQKIVLTKYGHDLRLFLNNNLQFSSLDEARYHESLAGAALSSVRQPKKVLILGGGDGLLAREVLRYSSVDQVTLVDIDPAVTTLAAQHAAVRALNQDSLHDSRVAVRNEDAFSFVFQTRDRYDIVLVDLVDPSNERLAKLYSQQFYRQVFAILTPQGVLATQATSSFFSPRAFATVAATVASARTSARVMPFVVNVPSFGEWGFVLATSQPGEVLSQPLPAGLRYQTSQRLRFALLDQPPTLPSAEPSTIVNPRIIAVYNSDMRQWRY